MLRLVGLCYTRDMPDFAAPVERLIDELKHLPGIGQKTAQRLAFHLLRIPAEDALGLADAIIRDAKEKIRTCTTCHNITDSDPVPRRCGPDAKQAARFAWWKSRHNILAIEKTRTYSGMYHVLGGISIAAARTRAGTIEYQEFDRAVEGRGRGRNHYCHELQRRKAKQQPCICRSY